MQVTVTIEDIGDPSKILSLSSGEEKDVRITAGNETRLVNGQLVERAIHNALNVDSDPNPNLLTKTQVSESEDEKILIVENHATDRTLVVVKIGQEVRNVNGRQFTTGIRHCLNAS